MAENKSNAHFVVTYVFLALLLCLVTPQTEAKVSRVRRQECQDGTYEHAGRQCCKCPAGFRVGEHCTEKSKIGKCEECVAGKEYQSHPTQQTTCEACTPCTHPNANLEEVTRCTPYHDFTCKCKENHYCPIGKTPCKVCEPCKKCGPEGEKVSCSATNNTICNDEHKDNTTAITLGVLSSLLAVAAAAGGVYLWKKRKSERKNTEHLEPPEEIVRLQTVVKTVVAVSLRPHIPEIAEEIGWATIRNLAQKSEISKGKLESCEEITDGVERTIALLNIWEEKESKDAAPKLLDYLRQTNQNSTADKVYNILCGS